MQYRNIMTDANRQLLIQHTAPFDLAALLNLLNRSSLDTHEDMERAVAYANPKDLQDVVVKLGLVTPVLTRILWEQLLVNPDINSLQKVVSSLNEHKILNEKTRDLAIGYPSSNLLSDAVETLKKRNILTKENFMTIVTRDNPVVISLIVE